MKNKKHVHLYTYTLLMMSQGYEDLMTFNNNINKI